MSRFIGICDDIISIISDKYFTGNNIQVVELPQHLYDVPDEKLIIDYQFKNNKFSLKKDIKPAHQLKIAFVSNYGMKCGISTYAENLFPQIIKHIGDYKLFLEINENPTFLFEDDKVSFCWKRGNDLNQLVQQIKEYDPDVILINHEWGIFSDAKYWLSFLTQISSYRAITIMHSVFPHHYDKSIVEASISEMVVHLEAGKQALIDKGISSKITVISHGCYPLEKTDKLWNFYKSEHTFIQIGFGLRYKGFENCLRATAILKEKYPDVFFTAIFSETNFGKMEHELYYRDLIKLIEELDIKNNVGIIRGFQTDEGLDAYLRTNQVAVFPYKSDPLHIVYGASGAARFAFSRKIPVISSNIPHFSDLPTIKTENAQEIAQQLDILFSDKQAIQQQIDKQNKFVEENDWEKTALKYIKLFENG